MIHAVNRAAFGPLVEAKLVDVLRRKAPQFVSLVADVDDAIVGHIVFSKVWLAGRDDLSIMGLGPMAVAPDYQRRGIGSALVRAGLTSCKQLGCQAVVVLGHAEYYPRFGFAPAVRYAIRCETKYRTTFSWWLSSRQERCAARLVWFAMTRRSRRRKRWTSAFMGPVS